jgi:hypothetical protein
MKNYGRKQNAAVKSTGFKVWGITSSASGSRKAHGITSSGYGGDRKQFGLKQDSYGKSSRTGVTSAYLKGKSPFKEKGFSDPRGK